MASVFIVAALLVATAQADPLGYYGMAPLNLTGKKGNSYTIPLKFGIPNVFEN